MELLYRLLDRLDTWLTAGLLDAIAASWWHRDDLVERKAWMIFIFSGAACAHPDGIGQQLSRRCRASECRRYQLPARNVWRVTDRGNHPSHQSR